MPRTKEEYLNAGWKLYHKYPNKRTRILSQLEDKGISYEDFNSYDSTMAVDANINILEERKEELKDIPGYSQTKDLSDKEIHMLYETLDSLEQVKNELPKVPLDADWVKDAIDAAQKEPMLRAQYEVQKEKEWEGLEPMLGGVLEPMGGLLQYLTQMGAGWLDLDPTRAFGETLHEREEWTANPFTGFGLWDLAEFKKNPVTGQQGFSPELLAMEEELNKMYESKLAYQQNMEPYRPYQLDEQMEAINAIIEQNKLIDPRIMPEGQ